MPIRNTVIGQRVDEAKVLRARELRREMTPAERTLWERLRNNCLSGFHFRRQQVIAGFIADFYCHSTALVVEVDGPIHEGQTDSDSDRDRVLIELGYRVIRFTNNEVMSNLDEVLDRILAMCKDKT